MNRAICAAVAAAVCSLITTHAPSAQAGAPPDERECVSAKNWTSLVEKHSPGATVAVLADVDGVEAKAVVQRVNDTPPVTHLEADHVVVLGARIGPDNTPAPFVLVAFFNHDCLVTSGRADPAEAAAMLSGQSI